MKTDKAHRGGLELELVRSREEVAKKSGVFSVACWCVLIIRWICVECHSHSSYDILCSSSQPCACLCLTTSSSLSASFLPIPLSIRSRFSHYSPTVSVASCLSCFVPLSSTPLFLLFCVPLSFLSQALGSSHVHTRVPPR